MTVRLSPPLSVVIVNYLAYEHLAECLQSLAPFRCDEILVVDHHTQPQSLAPLAARFPQVRFVPLAANPGFAAGVNRGVRETTGEFILLLNPDCIVTGDPGPLAAWLQAHPRAAVCGGIVHEADGTVQASARRFPGLTTGFAGRTAWLTKVWPRNPFTARNLVDGRPQAPIEVDWVSGAFTMVRREALAAVGGLDEQFFLYWEDADLCRRLKSANWETYYSTQADATHLTGRSSAHARRASLVAFHASAFRYYRKHGGRWSPILAPLVYVALQARLLLKLGALWFSMGHSGPSAHLEE